MTVLTHVSGVCCLVCLLSVLVLCAFMPCGCCLFRCRPTALSFTLCMFCSSFCCFMSLCPALAISAIADAPGRNVLPRGKQVGSFSVIWPGSLTWFFGNDSSQRSG